jgi:hypothetical protein
MLRTLALIIFPTGLVSLIVLNVTSCSILSSIKTLNQEQENRRAEEWHELIICDIIEGSDGKTFSEGDLKKEYLNEANKWKSGPPRNEPSDEEIKRAVKQLTRQGFAERTADGGYRKLGLPTSR